MVEIGGMPMLWHIMKIYSAHGFGEFLVALGYRPEVVKHFFLNYHQLRNDLTITGDGTVQVHDGAREDWRIAPPRHGRRDSDRRSTQAVGTWLRQDTFMMTYGDGVADIDLRQLLAFHRSHGKLATVTAVRPPARFGGLSFSGDLVSEFTEKPQIGEGWINGGFFVLEPRCWAMSTTTIRFGSASLSSASRRMGNSPHTSTTASGSRWTLCATFVSSRSCGRAGAYRGSCGTDRTKPRCRWGPSHRGHGSHPSTLDTAA